MVSEQMISLRNYAIFDYFDNNICYHFAMSRAWTATATHFKSIVHKSHISNAIHRQSGSESDITLCVWLREISCTRNPNMNWKLLSAFSCHLSKQTLNQLRVWRKNIHALNRRRWVTNRNFNWFECSLELWCICSREWANSIINSTALEKSLNRSFFKTLE